MRAFIFILIVVAFSCKKPFIGHVRGTVYEYGSGNPVVGAKVYLYQDPKKRNKGRFVIDSAVSNQNGEYIINFTKQIRNDYQIACKCSGYFEQLAIGSEVLEHDRTVRNITLIPYSYVSIRFIKNVYSSKYVVGHTEYGGCMFRSHYYNYQDTAKFYEPFNYVSSHICVIGGNQTATLKWDVVEGWKWDDRVSFSYNYFAKPGDTLFHTISF